MIGLCKFIAVLE